MAGLRTNKDNRLSEETGALSHSNPGIPRRAYLAPALLGLHLRAETLYESQDTRYSGPTSFRSHSVVVVLRNVSLVPGPVRLPLCFRPLTPICSVGPRAKCISLTSRCSTNQLLRLRLLVAAASLSDGSAAASLDWLCPLVTPCPKEAAGQTRAAGRSGSRSSLKQPQAQ